MNRPAVQFHVRPGDSLPDNVGTIVNKARELFAWAQQFDPVFKQVGFRKLSVMGVDVALDNNALAPRIVIGGVSSAKAGGGQSTTLKYRGLAYAASVPDSSSELGEHFRYPYLGTPGNYGTRQTYLSSAVPTFVVTPQGQHIRQTVARLVKRREDSGGLMVYQDTLRGILEGGRIQPFLWQPYWVREATGTGDDTTFHDTDEVWTTAGDIIWCNNKPVAAYATGLTVPYNTMAFPYRNKVVLVATTGYVGTIPLRSSPRSDTRGLPVSIEAFGSTYHPSTNVSDAADPIIPAPGIEVFPAVNQSGTRFAIYNSNGWAREYALGVSLGGDVEATLVTSYTGSTGSDEVNFITTTGTISGEPEWQPPNMVDTSSWTTGVIDIRWAHPNWSAPTSIVVASGFILSDPISQPVVGGYSQVDLTASLTVSGSPVAYCYVNDVLTATASREGRLFSSGLLKRTEGLVSSITYQEAEALPPPDGLHTAPDDANIHPPGIENIPWHYNVTTRYAAEAVDYRNESTVDIAGTDVVISGTRVTANFNLRATSGFSPTWAYTPPGVFGAVYSWVDTIPTVLYGYVSGTMACTATTTTCQILLADLHNGVLFYKTTDNVSVYDTVNYGGYTPNVVVGPVSSFNDNISEWIVTGTRTVSVTLRLHFGGGVFEHSAEVFAQSLSTTVGALYTTLSTLSEVITPGDPGTIPVMQGMCPYIAYRRPNTENAEMICAYGDNIDNVTPTTYFNATFTEQGVEDWLTSCGVPSALTTRIATCFRVGGPGPAVTTTETGA